MRHLLVAASCSLALLAGPALADGSQTGSAQVQIQPAKEQKICRAPVHQGMLLVRAKQCYTKAEWEARQKRMQKSIRDFQTRTLTYSPHW